jgi:hypothetical protein
MNQQFKNIQQTQPIPLKIHSQSDLQSSSNFQILGHDNKIFHEKLNNEHFHHTTSQPIKTSNSLNHCQKIIPNSSQSSIQVTPPNT